MTYRTNNSHLASLGCGGLTLLFMIIMAINAVVALWTDRNLDFWVSHFKGEQTDIPYWLSFIVTMIGNGVILLANVVAEVARFAI